MVSLACIGFLLITLLVLINHGCDVFQQAKEVSCYSIGLLILALWDGRVSIPYEIAIMLVAMQLWWFVCGLVSRDSESSIKKQVQILCCMMIAMYLTHFKYWQELVLASGLANCLMVGLQLLETKLPFVKDISDNKAFIKPYCSITFLPFYQHKYYKLHDAVGFIGNQNMLAIFLVPQVFIAFNIAEKSPYWLLAIPVILATIIATKCLNALITLCLTFLALQCMFGNWDLAICTVLILGIATYSVIKLNPSSLIVKDSNGKPQTFKLRTLRERISYYRIALDTILENKIFGVGLDNMRIHTPHIQRKLNEQSGGEFMNPKNYLRPWPNKCHNDYLQYAIDSGVIGLGFILSILVYTFVYNTGNYYLIASLVSILVTSLFFHTFQITTLNMLLWVLVFVNLPIQQIVFAPTWVGISLALLMMVLAYRFVLASFLGDYYLRKHFKTKDEDALNRASIHLPDSTLINSAKSQYYMMQGRFADMFKATLVAYARPDYQRVLWEASTNLGNLIYGMPLVCAQALYAEAISYYPHFEYAQDGLRKIKDYFKGQSDVSNSRADIPGSG